jgi:EipB-like
MTFRSVARVSLLAALTLAPAVALADALPLAPHRAAYELTLLSSRGKGVSSATGRIGLEFTGNACEGYATNFRQVTEISDGEGKTQNSDMRLTTFEAGDGKLLRFNGEKRNNGNRGEPTSGQAERATDGGLSVDIRQPKQTKMDVDGVAVFPTDHMIRLIAAAKKGERIMEIRLYDGSDGGEKIYDTTALIGSPVAPDGRPVEEASEKAGLKGMARWPVSISYFEQGNGERTPVYVLSFDLFENGVSGSLKLDFGDFALKGELKRLEILKETECKK